MREKEMTTISSCFHYFSLYPPELRFLDVLGDLIFKDSPHNGDLVLKSGSAIANLLYIEYFFVIFRVRSVFKDPLCTVDSVLDFW